MKSRQLPCKQICEDCIENKSSQGSLGAINHSFRQGFEMYKRAESTVLSDLVGDAKLCKYIMVPKKEAAIAILTRYMIIAVPTARKR